MQITKDIAAVVTGGASGLGYATAKALAEAGAKVAIFDMNKEKGEAVARELGGIFYEVNVVSEEQVLAGFAKARATHGQERILVNCAGTGKGGKTISRDKTTGEIRRYPTEDFDRIVQINLVGTFRVITASAAGMATLEPNEDGERGVITNTASVAAEEGQIGQVSYAASKAGIVGMTLNVARDLSSEGIRMAPSSRMAWPLK